MPPSRLITTVIFVVVGLTALSLLSSSTREVASRTVLGAVDVPKAVKDKIYEYDIPSIRFHFAKSSHKPPVQANSTSDDAAWHSDWRWLHPFSSYITWDADRVVLPPLPDRPYVYTYYDTTTKRKKAQKEADADLLETWKKAWWAHGFRPVILTQAEAMNHPLYQSMRQKGMQKSLESEFERWLAWGHMGTGLLASWHAVPMASPGDVLLQYLRRGQYEKLTRFQGLGAGLFVGEDSQINDAIQDTLANVKLGTYKTVIEAIHPDRFKIEESTSIAHYDTATIQSKYAALAKQMDNEPIKGQHSLNQLINAHLQTIWQNTFTNGIRVLKPLPAHTSKVVQPAEHLAQLLAECPDSMLQSSCPPNKPRCTPCVGSKIIVETKETVMNVSTMFTIGTVPHPYTMITLNKLDSDVSVPYVRGLKRDTWIKQVTELILGSGRGGPSRVVGLKDFVASEYSRSRGIWFTVEHFPADIDAPPAKEKVPSNEAHPEKEQIAPLPEHWLEEVDWYFGFAIPRTTVSHGESYNPVPGQSNEVKGVPDPLKGSYDPDDPTHEEMLSEIDLLKKARAMIKSKDETVKRMRNVAEAWNLADTEVWKFVAAYRARSVLERKKWQEEEAAFSGPGSSRGGRWF